MNSCSGCHRPINEKFFLKADNKYWHEDCLRCDCCSVHLGEIGRIMYSRGGLNLCRNDYLKLFGDIGYCARCHMEIGAHEMVMKVKKLVYHLECFNCFHCKKKFCVGDEFRVSSGNKIVCKNDFWILDLHSIASKLSTNT